jgi:uncharacterized protein (TIGR02271 family)
MYLDDQTGRPEWITARTGLFGIKESFVPLNQAAFADNRITVPFDKNHVKNAPRIDPDGNLSPAEEDQLYTYYGRSSSGGDTRTTGVAGTTPAEGRHRDGDFDETDDRTVGRDTSGPTTDDAMTRSEERLVAGTRTEQTGRVRLRKHVVTEQQQVTVPVSREEVSLKREPITDANLGNAMDGPEISEEEHEVTLSAERPVVDTEAVPVERIRLNKETVRDTETVGGEVRTEQIELDDDADTRRRNRS